MKQITESNIKDCLGKRIVLFRVTDGQEFK